MRITHRSPTPFDWREYHERFHKAGKSRRRFALVNACARASFNEGRSFKSLTIALGGVLNTPVRAQKPETALSGKKPTRENVKRAVETLDDINPIPSIHGSPWYKRRIAKIILRDVLLQCAERARIRPS